MINFFYKKGENLRIIIPKREVTNADKQRKEMKGKKNNYRIIFVGEKEKNEKAN